MPKAECTGNMFTFTGCLNNGTREHYMVPSTIIQENNVHSKNHNVCVVHVDHFLSISV